MVGLKSPIEKRTYCISGTPLGVKFSALNAQISEFRSLGS